MKLKISLNSEHEGVLIVINKGFLFEYIPHDSNFSDIKKRDEEIISMLATLCSLNPKINYKVRSIVDTSKEYALFEELKRYQRRIKACYERLNALGLDIYLESLSRKFKSRQGRGYLYLKGSLIVYDDVGPLLALPSYEAKDFLSYLLTRGVSILEDLSKTLPTTKVNIGMHEELILKFLRAYEEDLLDYAVLLECPIGCVIFGRHYDNTYTEILKGPGDYRTKRYQIAAMRAWSVAYQLKADIIIIKNPKKLAKGTVYLYYGTGRVDTIEIENKLRKMKMGLSKLRVDAVSFDPLYHYEEYDMIIGDEITIIEAKTDTSTSKIKEAIGQVLTYSEILRIDLGLLGYKNIAISKGILLPNSRINPLLQLVCEKIGIKIILV